jgi:hypothetical protein
LVWIIYVKGPVSCVRRTVEKYGSKVSVDVISWYRSQVYVTDRAILERLRRELSVCGWLRVY